MLPSLFKDLPNLRQQMSSSLAIHHLHQATYLLSTMDEKCKTDIQDRFSAIFTKRDYYFDLTINQTPSEKGQALLPREQTRS